MNYKYKGIDVNTGLRVQGVIEGVSHQDIVRKLAESKIDAIHVDLEIDKPIKGKKLSVTDLVIPLQELATLLHSGVSLVDSLRSLSHNKEMPNLADGFSKMVNRIEGGISFSDSIKESKLPFPPYVRHLVSAGELSGQLSLSLTKASEQMNYEQQIKSDLKSALTYPIVLVLSGLVAMLIIFFAVVPKFSHLLDSEKDLPLLAYLVLSAGKSATDYPVVIFGGIIAIVVAGLTVASSPVVKNKVLDWLVEMPVVGPWLSEQDAAKWASLCSAMLIARVSLVSALRLASESCRYTRRKSRALNMIADIEAGQSFSDALSRSELLPSTSMNLISVGDKTGQLGEMLHAVSSLHDKSCKRRMKNVMTLMEPIAILLVGVLIGIMILGIVLAITASTDIEI